MSLSHSRKTRRGFTLVELLVVIAIIGILVGMLLPAVQAVREAARRATCLNNVRQVVLACHNYQSSNLKFPAASNSAATPAHSSWTVAILSFLDQQNLADEMKSGLFLSGASQRPMPMLLCASSTQEDERATDADNQNTSHYSACLGSLGTSADFNYDNGPSRINFWTTSGGQGAVALNGMFSPQRPQNPANPLKRWDFRGKYGKNFEDCRDGSSNTIAFMENSRSQTDNWNPLRKGWAWGVTSNNVDQVNNANSIVGGMVSSGMAADEVPTPINANLTNPLWNQIPSSSNHNGGVQVAMVDGSAKFVNENVELSALMAAGSIKEGADSVLE